MKQLNFNKVSRISHPLLNKLLDLLRLEQNWFELNFVYGILRAQKQYPKLTIKQYQRILVLLQKYKLIMVTQE